MLRSQLTLHTLSRLKRVLPETEAAAISERCSAWHCDRHKLRRRNAVKNIVCREQSRYLNRYRSNQADSLLAVPARWPRIYFCSGLPFFSLLGGTIPFSRR